MMTANKKTLTEMLNALTLDEVHQLVKGDVPRTPAELVDAILAAKKNIADIKMATKAMHSENDSILSSFVRDMLKHTQLVDAATQEESVQAVEEKDITTQVFVLLKKLRPDAELRHFTITSAYVLNNGNGEHDLEIAVMVGNADDCTQTK